MVRFAFKIEWYFMNLKKKKNKQKMSVSTVNGSKNDVHSLQYLLKSF